PGLFRLLSLSNLALASFSLFSFCLRRSNAELNATSASDFSFAAASNAAFLLFTFVCARWALSSAGRLWRHGAAHHL
ncbi:hypothetical protein, partial [Escherichia coli]|uniref:hypothetical protein n=1 Tax=Escherichia coli TaxID=562 RepID=UPI001BCB6C9E